MSISLNNGVLLISGGAWSDAITVSRNGSQIEVNENGSVSSYDASQVSKVRVESRGGDDYVNASGLNNGSSEANIQLEIIGGSGNDVIIGSSGDDFINGDGRVNEGFVHNIVTNGSGDSDTIFAGDGNDHIVIEPYGFGNDTVFAGGGDDKVIITTDDDNFVDAGPGNDTVVTGLGNDTVINAE